MGVGRFRLQIFKGFPSQKHVTKQRGSFDGSFYLVGVVATALGDIGPENRPSQNESRFPTITFQGLC